jgi:hypothetical protein
MAEHEAESLRADLFQLFERGVDAPLTDAGFDILARRVFAFQFERNPAYAAYCRRRALTPANVDHWSRIPAVPTSAFKEVRLVSGDPTAAQAVFRTSGTTRGPERRGEHHVLDLTVYEASLLPTFAAYVLPDGRALPMLSLVPTRVEVPDSSLGHMIDVVSDRLGAPGGGCFASVAAGVDHAGLERALRRHQEQRTPVCLLGTSFAFVHWLDGLRSRGKGFQLPSASRIMDTGGFKGRSREVAAPALRAGYEELLGVPDDHVVNEYGMTEMCSQFYDTVLRDAVRGAAARERHKAGPPWARTVVVDPETLEPLPAGSEGLLRHYDLANIGSVLAIQTEDLGVEVPGGFVLLGRAAGAPPRGCSVAMDLLLAAVAEEGRE